MRSPAAAALAATVQRLAQDLFNAGIVAGPTGTQLGNDILGEAQSKDGLRRSAPRPADFLSDLFHVADDRGRHGFRAPEILRGPFRIIVIDQRRVWLLWHSGATPWDPPGGN